MSRKPVLFLIGFFVGAVVSLLWNAMPIIRAAKAMPVLLLTDTDVETWLAAPTDEALKLQKPAPDDAVVVLPEQKKAA
jgi:hypothetical protein